MSEATATVSVEADMGAIAAAAGGGSYHTRTASKANRTVALVVQGCTQAALDTAVAAYSLVDTLRGRRKVQVKALAYQTIVARLPEWKQRNLTSRGVEFLDKRLDGETLTPSEAAEQAAIKVSWAWVQAVREASGAAETALDAEDTADGMDAVVAAIAWPAYPEGGV